VEASQDNQNLLLIIIAIFIPPLAVGLKEGIGAQLLINIVLTLLIPWLGGFIHALWVILRS